MKDQDQAETLATRTGALVRTWLRVAEGLPVDKSAERLGGVLKDPNGLSFTVGFVDGVVRPDDLVVAAKNLRAIAPLVPQFLPWYLRAAVRLGGAAAPVIPGIVVPIARAVLRKMVSHLIIDATDKKLTGALARLRQPGVRLNINLLGEAVLGASEASRRLSGIRRILERPDVDYVSIKVSSTVTPLPMWSFDEHAAHVVDQLTPLYEYAANAASPKFINLDMEEYKDLDLTLRVFMDILDRPELTNLSAGIVLQAYLPDALGAMQNLQAWAQRRTSSGGAPIKVRLVKGANLPMERVDADLHGWPEATLHSKEETDRNYKRVLDWALRPERIENVRIGIAGHNLFDIGHAWLLAQDRAIGRGIDFEMLLGMAQAQAQAVRADVSNLVLYTPVVHPKEFDVAIAYLIRRLEEGASPENFMSAVFDLSKNETLFAREQGRFEASLEGLEGPTPAAHRQQNRTEEIRVALTSFDNEPDTDFSLHGNRKWASGIASRIRSSTLGTETITGSVLSTQQELDAVITAATAATEWRALSGAQRADVLRAAGQSLAMARADLIEVMASETGKTIDQGDPEVSEAIDFANYYADRAVELDTIDGAVFQAASVTVVTPPWNFPVAIPAGSVLAALAAGSAVIVKPARQARRCGAVMVEALWRAGVPKSALHLVQFHDPSFGERLISDPRVGRVILTGGFETAELFRSFRKDLPLLAETSGKNAIIVTPSADLDLAARDVANSAFGHAGQKCSAASLVILVGSVAKSSRFASQLEDAVRSITVGYPSDSFTQMGPIIEPARGKLLRALTTLEPGQRWLIEPRQLDDSGRLWSPGVRTGVARGSEFHLTEYFGPVLGVMHASTLGEAIEIQNQVAYGLTAGLHSLDAEEIQVWQRDVQAGNLYINRGITGAIVRRQPFGGWRRSSVGPGSKAGGPNYLFSLGEWTPKQSSAAVTSAPDPRLTKLEAAHAAAASEGTAMLARSLNSDRAAWRDEFGQSKDVSGLAYERNVLRYAPVSVTVRLAEDGSVTDLVRVVCAGILTGSTVEVSSARPLDERIVATMREQGVAVTIVDEGQWLASIAEAHDARFRLIGGSVRAIAEATNGRPDIAVFSHAVTESGRIEMLPFLREQAVSITAHRFGTPIPALSAV